MALVYPAQLILLGRRPIARRRRLALIVVAGDRSSTGHFTLSVYFEHKQHRRVVHLRIVRAYRLRRPSHAALESDVLLTVHLISDGRSHSRAPGLHLIKLLAFVGAEGAE